MLFDDMAGCARTKLSCSKLGLVKEQPTVSVEQDHASQPGACRANGGMPHSSSSKVETSASPITEAATMTSLSSSAENAALLTLEYDKLHAIALELP
eukprot:CAMPEP_0172803080 /NCGR_PEP_ID=MMETSP1075-20121228/4256_1 /TAXON_ID=2916 /ORGANISM="Ceratium fusus, Strain PA161109" /LENGTH=96 /DNA_ID=CAMNT_0013641431 /DNA_START=413 /DNA_END=700 /DNA_ORIENTATION=+